MKKLFIPILFLIFYAIYLLFTQILFGEKNLIAIQGQLNKKWIFVKTENKDSKPAKYAFLTFTLNGDQRFYSIKLAIDSLKYGDRILTGVELALSNAGELEVWIKKGDLDKTSPKVYQLKADGTNIFSIIKRYGNNLRLFVMMFALFLLFIFIVLLKNMDLRKLKNINQIKLLCALSLL